MMPRTVWIPMRNARFPNAARPCSDERSRLQTSCARASTARTARAIGGTFISHDMVYAVSPTARATDTART